MLKDIIESMILGYLNESEEDGLMESIFQEVQKKLGKQLKKQFFLNYHLKH